MNDSPDLILVGASVRSMAQSAIRVGLLPRCYDMFGDSDLKALLAASGCEWHPFTTWDEVLSSLPKGRHPIVVAGGLEASLPAGKIPSESRVYAPEPNVARSIASPDSFFDCLQTAGVCCPKWEPTEPADSSIPWLAKTVPSSGGLGIRNWDRHSAPLNQPHYFQQYISGIPASATFASDGTKIVLLGTALVLSGLRGLGATGFQFCGNVGPVTLSHARQQELMMAASAIVNRWQLTGVFGIDFILADKRLHVLECNPRITASHELHELFGNRINHIEQHLSLSGGKTISEEISSATTSRNRATIARLILWATQTAHINANLVNFMLQHQWRPDSHEPGFADIPSANSTALTGTPFCSLYFDLTKAAAVEHLLRPLPFSWQTGQLIREIQARYRQVCTSV